MLYLAAMLVSSCALSAEPAALTADQVVARMVEAETARLTTLHSYTATRHYVLDNKRFNKRVEMVVKMTWTSPGPKTFEIVSEQGSSILRNRVLRAMLDAEVESSKRHEAARITPANYEFRLVGKEPSPNGRSSYVLEIAPKTKDKFLLRARVSVDTADFAVVKVEGVPAKNPSIWTREVRIVQFYEKVRGFWLPRSSSSTTDVRLFGSTEVTVEYSNYQINAGQQAPGGTVAGAR